LLHGLKYIQDAKAICTEHAQRYTRKLVTRYKKEAEATRDHTWQDLAAKSKWLHWEEVIEVVKAQREAYETATSPQERARESQRYAQLLLYTTIPPGRAEEYRTLELNMGGNQTQMPHRHQRNILHVSQDGHKAVLEIGKYKNSRYHGRQRLDISDVDYLVPHLLRYIKEDRPLLLQKRKDHLYLFMVSTVTVGQKIELWLFIL
jgi:hypothetical protein